MLSVLYTEQDTSPGEISEYSHTVNYATHIYRNIYSTLSEFWYYSVTEI